MCWLNPLNVVRAVVDKFTDVVDIIRLLISIKSTWDESFKKTRRVVEESVPIEKTTDDQGFPENITAAEYLLLKVVGNHLILANIMMKMKTRDLITCRLVNSWWKKAADSTLVKRTDLKAIEMRFFDTWETFFINSYQHRKLSDLKNVLENSSYFPCHDFKIEGPLEDHELQRFLSNPRCGGQIKRLSLNLSVYYNPLPVFHIVTNSGEIVTCGYPTEKRIDCFRKLLTQQAVNLNSLTLRALSLDCMGSKSTEKIFPSPVILSKLRYLEINQRPPLDYSPGQFRWMEELLIAAPNLTSFSTAQIAGETLASLININKSHLLTKMTVENESSCPQDDRILSQFKLKEFRATYRFYDYFGHNGLPWFSEAFFTRGGEDPVIREPSLRLLRLNSDTLKSITLDLFHAVACLPTCQIFVHVKTFCLVGLEKLPEENTSKIPLHAIFPNLENIRLEGNFNAKIPDYGTEANIPFVVGETMEKVKTLEIQHVCPIDWLKLLSQVFPNVTHLILENYWDFPRSGHLFWAFKSLNFIDLGLLLGVANIDAVFTGFSNTTCQDLTKRSAKALGQLAKSGARNIGTEKEIGQLRVSPSIVQLKELRELRIKIADTDSHEDVQNVVVTVPWRRSRERWRPACQPLNVDLMSPVSSVYAFGMMPTLQSVDISLTPNETKFAVPVGFSRLQQLEAALKPMAEHPLVTLYPIQMNN